MGCGFGCGGVYFFEVLIKCYLDEEGVLSKKCYRGKILILIFEWGVVVWA